LERLGFRDYKDFAFWELSDMVKTIKLIPAKGYWYPSIVSVPELSYEDTPEIFLCKINYIHELQNIYRVAYGEDMNVSKLTT
jgi:hypothetical protein